MSDDAIITLLEEDTEKGMITIIDLYGDSVKTICCAILKGFSYEDIQEAISDVFVGLWSAISKGNFDAGKTSIKFYIYGIARKTALNRRRKLMKNVPASDIDEVEKPLDFNLEAEVLKKADYQIINALIQELNSPDKEIFIYRYYKQYSIKEIADLLKLSAKAVENKLTRGRKKIKEAVIKVQHIHVTLERRLSMSIRNRDFDKELNNIHHYISDDEKMADKEKSEIFNLVMKKIEKEKQEEQTKRKRDFPRKNKITKVVAAALAAVIVGGTVTVGAKTIFMKTPIAKYFNIGSVNDATQKEKLEKTTGKMLQNLNISEEQKGLKVSINQIFGDDYACYLSVNVTGFQKNKKFDKLSGKGTFGEVNVDIPDKSIIQTSIHDEGLNNDNSKNYLLIIGCEKMKGSHVKLQLKDFGYYNDEDEFLPVIKGTWNLDFDLTYSANPKKYTVGKEINIYGAKAVWNDVTFTPISASVSLTMKDKNDAELPTGVKPNDELCVNFADGSSISSYDVDDDAIYDDTTNISISFSEIKNLEDIVSVTFAGETYTIQSKKCLKNHFNNQSASFCSIFRPNKVMKCAIVFSDDMHKILKKYEVRNCDNVAFEKKAQKIEPVVEKGNKLSKLPTLVYLAHRF